MLTALEGHYWFLTLTLMEHGKQKQCKKCSSSSLRIAIWCGSTLLIQDTGKQFADPAQIITVAKTNNHLEPSEGKELWFNRTADYRS